MNVHRIIGEIREAEVIAAGRGIHELRLLVRHFGSGQWRKMKGKAQIETDDGQVLWVELHWYEAHGIGRRKLKIKRILDE